MLMVKQIFFIVKYNKKIQYFSNKTYLNKLLLFFNFTHFLPVDKEFESLNYEVVKRDENLLN